MEPTMSMDLLVTALLDLEEKVPVLPAPLLVGGGFGLYLKQRWIEGQPELETLIPGERWPPARSTEDIDLLLPAEVIVSVLHMQSIRRALDQLGYEPIVESFQFRKQTPYGPVRIDLLAGDVSEAQSGKVKVNAMRIKPKGGGGLHAYLTREAIAIEQSPGRFTVEGTRSSGTRAALTACVPNPFTYLLMKLHAFNDRVGDERKGLAAHHALDIYRIVAMLTRDEYELVRNLAVAHAASEPLQTAQRIVREAFGDEHRIGALRLRAGASEAGLQRANLRVSEFIAALTELLVPSR